MKVIIALVFEHDAKDWAEEYAIPETEAVNDFAAVLRRTVDDGGIPQTLDRNWPMMRGHTTAYTVDGLDATTRDELLRLLQEAHDADQDEALITEIKRHLAAHPQDLYGRAPCWVIFHTVEWDNGNFLTGSEATVYFDDGDNVPFDFEGSSVDDLLTDMYGARGAMAALGVDLREATLEFDDYGDNVPDTLGIPTNDHSEGDGCAIYATDHTVTREGVEVPITDLRNGDVFIDYDDKPWCAARVGRDGYDVHVDIKPADEG